MPRLEDDAHAARTELADDLVAWVLPQEFRNLVDVEERLWSSRRRRCVFRTPGDGAGGRGDLPGAAQRLHDAVALGASREVFLDEPHPRRGEPPRGEVGQVAAAGVGRRR